MSKYTIGLIAVVGIATAKRLNTKPTGGLSSQLIGEYNDYVGKWNKGVTDTADYQMRVGIYEQNKALVEETNAQAEGQGPDALTLELNKFADLTQEEFNEYTGLLPSHIPEGRRPGNFEHRRPGSRLGGGLGSHRAVTVDHHADGKMTPVKDQGQCGSCWAFAANSALEGALSVLTGKAPVRLSEQQVVDCTLYDRKDQHGNHYDEWGCKGGWMSSAWRYFQNNGFMTNEAYPYTSGQTTKESDCAWDPQKTIGKVTTYGDIYDVDTMLKRVERMPVTIAMSATGKFGLYKSGVLQFDDCNGQMNHALVVVGYTLKDDGDGDDDDKEPDRVCKTTKWWHTCKDKQDDRRRLADEKGLKNYWKIQNSWGKWWGDEGFVRFNIDESGRGVCGMYEYIDFVEGVYDE